MHSLRRTVRVAAVMWFVLLLVQGALAQGAGSLNANSALVQLRPVAEARVAGAALVIDSFQHDTRFFKQTTPGTAEADLSEVLLGTRSLRVTTDGNGLQVNLRASGLGPLDLGHAFLRLHLRIDGIENLDALYYYLSNDGFETFDSYRIMAGNDALEERFLEDGEWATITTALGTPMWRAPSVDLTRVTDMQISAVDNGNGPVTVWLGGLEAVKRPERGVVTVVFDDARSGVYELAVPHMQRFGVRASVAVITDLVGVEGFLTLDQMHLLERFAGWEMVAHHVSELPAGGFDTLAEADLRYELEGVKRWLIENGFRRGADVIAYPYGGFNAGSLEAVRQYFAAGRTILQSAGLETMPPADPYRIRALSVVGTDSVDALKAAIDRAAREKSWLVLVFHQLSNEVTEYDTFYSAVDFALVMAHLAAADVDVLTLSEAVIGR